MNPIPNIQNVPLLAWAAGAPIARDITKHIRFGFTCEVTADIATDAVFKFQSAPASVADPCIPGAWTDVEEVAICSAVAVGTPARVIIPAGTKAGAICHFTLPCRPNKFIRIDDVSGDTANTRITINLSGPIVD